MSNNSARAALLRSRAIYPILCCVLLMPLLAACGFTESSSGDNPPSQPSPITQSQGDASPTAGQPNPTEQQTTGQAENPPAVASPASSVDGTQVVIPGMPGGLCVANPGQTPEATQEATQAVAQPPAATPAPAAPFVFYCGGTPAAGWSDASYGGGKADYNSNDFPRDGKPTIKVTYGDGWGAFSMADWNKSNLPDTDKYSHLHFWINGGQQGGQIIGAMVYTNGGEGQRLHVEQYIPGGKVPANKWQEVFIPLEDLGATSGLTVERVVFQEVTGKTQPPYYIDGIELYSDNKPTPTPVIAQAQITVDMSKNRKPISPYIYGTSLATDDVVKDANISINRLGGNPYSTYNWTLGNARNAGSDWEFRNYSRETGPEYMLPSGLADMFFKGDKSSGADTLLTVPTLGYVARNDNNDTRSTGVPQEGGAPVSPGSEAIPGYDPSHNQQTVFVKSHATKGSAFSDPPSTSGDVYQDEWINHLVRTFGKAADGGVRFYSMDNEPDLWADDTHVDVHPVRPGYDSMLQNFLEYAKAVKAVDSTAQVTGPVVSGWTGIWYSALDRGDDSFGTHADRNAHGGMPLVPWFLDQVHKADQASGKRTLDVLDVHYYPQAQGVMQDKVDKDTSALRLRSTRALWDPTYQDESWIGRTEAKEPQLIPRLQGWIDQYYPGTKIGITEWKWGAEGTMNGALAIADVLGIYGREGVYLANYYTNPPLGSPGLNAFKMYRNYDGHDTTFGDVSVAAQSSAQDKLAVYASEDTHSNQLKVMVLNKSDREQLAGTINLQGGSFSGAAKVYGFSNATGLAIKQLPDAPLSGSTVNYTFPPYSITLLVVDKAR